jgi:hypothetical protein
MHFLLVHIHVSVNKKWQSNSLLPLLASENPRSVRYVRASRQRHVSRANVLHVLIFIYFSLNLQKNIYLYHHPHHSLSPSYSYSYSYSFLSLMHITAARITSPTYSTSNLTVIIITSSQRHTLG